MVNAFGIVNFFILKMIARFAQSTTLVVPVKVNLFLKINLFFENSVKSLHKADILLS